MEPNDTIAIVARVGAWRVVTPDGHHDVPTLLDHGEWRAQCPTGRWYGSSDPRIAVMAVSLKMGWPVSAILSPLDRARRSEVKANDLDALRGLRSEAAYGPLRMVGEDGDYTIVDRVGNEVGTGYDRGTAVFFAACGEAVEALCDEVERLRPE